MDFQNKDNANNKYVCPSDRQLALRAKLRTGWSTGKSADPLRPEEQAAIISVIRRNEDIESAERIRVGKLVERVEKIRERAAECGPHCCRLCGETFGLLRPTKLVCDDCKKPVCSKCSIELSPSKGKTKEYCLCKICSETKEMWKKSGAWFFKGVPRYEIPPKTQPNKSTIGPPVLSKNVKTTKLGMQIEDSSSSEEDEDHDETSKEQTPQQQQEQQQKQEKSNRNCVQRGDSFRLRAVGSFKNFFNNSGSGTSGERKYSIFFNRQSSKSESQAQSGDWDSISTSSVLTALRRESANMRRGSILSNWSISESSSFTNNDFGNGSNGCCGMSNQMNQTCREPLFGWLEVSICYSEGNHTLECTVLRARDLPVMDSAGLADPFCKINIITPEGTTKQAKWMRIKTVHKTRNPEFNESVTFLGVEPEELGNSILYVVILDDDKYGHDFLGAAKIELSTLYNTSPLRMTIPLATEDQYCIEAGASGPWPRGQILISLCYNTKKRTLVVGIKRCTNLLPMDSNGSSDPFVKIQLKPDPHRKKFKTNIKWRNLNPVYNEEFQFETRPNDLDKQSLIITVWDKDIGKSNDFLGSLILGHSSKGRRLKQWTDCVRLPDQFHEQWHCISSDHPPH